MRENKNFLSMTSISNTCKKHSKKKILLTGGSGFIGKNILESFLSDKYIIVTPSSSNLNLLDTQSVDKYFKRKFFDVVLHAACKPGHRNAKDLKDIFYSNVRMFENLVRHKDKYNKFINFGSGAIYDTSKNISSVKEDKIFDNIGKAEHDFCKYVVAKRIESLDNFLDLNIFGLFGKYEEWQIRFISNSICKALFNLPITIKQNRVFSYLYIDDLMPILDFFISNTVKYKSYNIVPDNKISLLKIAKIVKCCSNKEIKIKIAKKGYGLEYTGDNSRLIKECKNIRFTDIKDSIQNLYNYYKQNIKLIDKNLLLTDK